MWKRLQACPALHPNTRDLRNPLLTIACLPACLLPSLCSCSCPYNFYAFQAAKQNNTDQARRGTIEGDTAWTYTGSYFLLLFWHSLLQSIMPFCHPMSRSVFHLWKQGGFLARLFTVPVSRNCCWLPKWQRFLLIRLLQSIYDITVIKWNQTSKRTRR